MADAYISIASARRRLAAKLAHVKLRESMTFPKNVYLLHFLPSRIMLAFLPKIHLVTFRSVLYIITCDFVTIDFEISSSSALESFTLHSGIYHACMVELTKT